VVPVLYTLVKRRAAPAAPESGALAP
jgi:hypothetical protein